MLKSTVNLLVTIALALLGAGLADAQVQTPRAAGSGGEGGGTVTQGTPAATSDAAAWPFKIVFGNAQVDPRDISDRVGRALGQVTFASAQPVTQSGSWSFSLTNFPTSASTSAVAVRCVNAAGNAFESCAGSGGAGSDVNITGVGGNAVTTAVPVSGTFWQATQPVSLASVPSHPVTNAGTFAVQVTSVPSTAVTGPLTDAELRATAVPVSLGSVPSHAVTNAGTFAVQVTSAPTTAVTGPVTDAQLRASAVPVSVASLPSHPVTNAGTFAVQVTSAPTTAVTGPLTDAQLRASAVPVTSAAPGTLFQCAMTSTAVTSTVVTGCTAPGSGLSRYITDISYNSSIISTTANFLTLQYGTGSNCGTGTTVVFRQANSVAFLPVSAHFTSPIKLAANTDLCFLHPGAGTRLINVQGYIAQ